MTFMQKIKENCIEENSGRTCEKCCCDLALVVFYARSGNATVATIALCNKKSQVCIIYIVEYPILGYFSMLNTMMFFVFCQESQFVILILFTCCLLQIVAGSNIEILRSVLRCYDPWQVNEMTTTNCDILAKNRKQHRVQH